MNNLLFENSNSVPIIYWLVMNEVNKYGRENG